MDRPTFRIGLISDTHGLLRPEAVRALQGADRILHAGDIGDLAILRALESIAPVFAVRGNNDLGPAANPIPFTLDLEFGGVRLHVLHDLNDLDRKAAAGKYEAVIAGHSHKPAVVQQDGVLYVNPGSAGPRRFRLPVSVGWLTITPSGVSAEICTLDV
ncbi:MAG: metallophosphoesterase [Herminiimonas sp.]|nr:metallophosphoesterase [Herminiimonas sp.]